MKVSSNFESVLFKGSQASGTVVLQVMRKQTLEWKNTTLQLSSEQHFRKQSSSVALCKSLVYLPAYTPPFGVALLCRCEAKLPALELSRHRSPWQPEIIIIFETFNTKSLTIYNELIFVHTITVIIFTLYRELIFITDFKY